MTWDDNKQWGFHFCPLTMAFGERVPQVRPRVHTFSGKIILLPYEVSPTHQLGTICMSSKTTPPFYSTSVWSTVGQRMAELHKNRPSAIRHLIRSNTVWTPLKDSGSVWIIHLTKISCANSLYFYPLKAFCPVFHSDPWALDAGVWVVDVSAGTELHNSTFWSAVVFYEMVFGCCKEI